MRSSWLYSVLLWVFATHLAPAQWKLVDPGFHTFSITSNGGVFWACGSREGIASSSDGEHWTLMHQPNGVASLLGISFFDTNFGYAYGTGGTVLITEDGGKHWTKQIFGSETILQASLSSPNHGIVRLSNRLLITHDGGRTLQPVIPTDPTLIKRFRGTQNPVALSGAKMAVVLKEGPYSEGGYLATNDGGRTWNFYDPPSTGIGTLLRKDGAYWMVGMEVVGKDQPGGGHSVPLLATSSDGLSWKHGEANISSCHMEGCDVCKLEGCLASTSTLARVFDSPLRFARFPVAESATAEWAANEKSICMVAGGLRCTNLSPVNEPGGFAGGLPREKLIENLGGEAPAGSVRCLACDMDHILIDKKIQGGYQLEIVLMIASDGTVSNVALSKAPSPEIEAKLKQQIMQWIFEPPIKDGQPVNINLRTYIRFQVIRPK